MTSKDNNTIQWRITCLEKKVDELDGKIDTILSNDLPHIKEELASLGTRIYVVTAINVGAIILGIILNKAL